MGSCGGVCLLTLIAASALQPGGTGAVCGIGHAELETLAPSPWSGSRDRGAVLLAIRAVAIRTACCKNTPAVNAVVQE